MYYIKQAFVSFAYLVFLSLTAIGFLLIGNDLMWLKVIFCVLDVALYVFIVGAMSFKDGETALKVRIANDLERKEIIRTGEDRPLKLKEEYKPWKGFLSGAITCVPLIIFLIIHTLDLLVFKNGSMRAGGFAGMLYMIVFDFTRIDLNVAATAYEYYWTLTAIPLITLTTGIPYIMGAKKIEKQQKRIQSIQAEIYGGTKQ